MKNKKTDVTVLMGDLDGGVFANKVSEALSQVALGVINNGTVGKVEVDFTLKRIGNSAQVELTHVVKFVKPTVRGKASEEDKTSTALYVGHGGLLSIDQSEQIPMFNSKGIVNQVD